MTQPEAAEGNGGGGGPAGQLGKTPDGVGTLTDGGKELETEGGSGVGLRSDRRKIAGEVPAGSNGGGGEAGQPDLVGGAGGGGGGWLIGSIWVPQVLWRRSAIGNGEPATNGRSGGGLAGGFPGETRLRAGGTVEAAGREIGRGVSVAWVWGLRETKETGLCWACEQ